MSKNIETRREVSPRYEIVSYNPNVDELSKLKEIVDSSYQKNRNFFETDVDGIKINFIYSDEELAKEGEKVGIKFQGWHKALAKGNSLWIFSPKLPKGIDSTNIMTHEIAHVFTNKLFYEGNPAWLREGIASVVADRYSDNNFKSNFKFKDVHDGLQFQQHPIYDKSTVFTRSLIEEFGKDKLFQFLSSVKNKIGITNDYYNFCNLFRQVYNNEFEMIENKFMKKKNN